MYILHSLCWVNIRPRKLPTPDIEQQDNSGREHRHLGKSYPIRNREQTMTSEVNVPLNDAITAPTFLSRTWLGDYMTVPHSCRLLTMGKRGPKPFAKTRQRVYARKSGGCNNWRKAPRTVVGTRCLYGMDPIELDFGEVGKRSRVRTML